MSKILMSLFNPFSIKRDADYSNIGGHIQEVIYYGESRFRSILVYLDKEDCYKDLDRMTWTQKLLHRELV